MVSRNRSSGRTLHPAPGADELFRQGQWAAAALAYRRRLLQHPEDFEVHNRLGISLQNAGDLAGAAEVFLQALARFQSSPILFANLGVVLFDLGHHDEAVHACETAAMLAPEDPRVLARWGGVLRLAGRVAEATPVLERALKHDPGNLAALFAKGAIAFGECRFEEAQELFLHVARVEPHFKDALSNLGSTAMRRGDFAAGERWYRQACEREPDNPVARWGLGMVLLGQGDYARGWSLHESRIDCPALAGTFAPLRQALTSLPRWKGEALPGRRLLVVPEQGLGDFLQFARYLPQAARRAGALRVLTPTPLLSLMRAQTGAAWRDIEFVDRDPVVPEVAAVEVIMSLPWRMGLDECVSQVSGDAYLVAPSHGDAEPCPPLPAARTSERSGPLRVGLVWAGAPGHMNDRLRSLPFQALAPLLQTDGVRWISLQKGGAERVLREDPLGAQVLDLGSELQDLGQTAQHMGALDLLVSVDSAPVHLAGALGCPVWALIPRAPDWRWLLEGGYSHWYESLRLWRQGDDGQWGPVIERVAMALRQRVAQRRESLACA